MRWKLLLALALVVSPAAVQAAWHQASSTHFVVYSDDDPESVRNFAIKLEKFDKAMRVFNRIPDEDLGPANRVTVFVLPDVYAVRELINPNSNIAGFYIARAEGSVAFTPRQTGADSVTELGADAIFFHEYAHHFMRQNFSGGYPPWFVEGFAEFYSTAAFPRDGSVDIGRPADHRAIELSMIDELPIEAVFDTANRNYNEIEWQTTVYGRGWLLTHYLNFEPSRAGQLSAYLTAIKTGKTSLAAAREALGDLRKLERELGAYLRNRRMEFRKVIPSALSIGQVSVRLLSAGEVAAMPVRMKSKRGVDLAGAKKLVEPMRRIAGRFAADAAVQAASIEVEYDAGNLDEADAAIARTLAIQPDNIDALTYKAMVAIARAKAAKSKDAATWQAVRRLISAANRVDPDDPEPLILFYESYGAQGIEPTRNAVDGLIHAYELAPHDGTLRLQVGRQYLIDGKAAEARTALAPVAYDPHGGKGGKTIQAILERLAEGGTAAALQLWSAKPDQVAGADDSPREGD